MRALFTLSYRDARWPHMFVINNTFHVATPHDIDFYRSRELAWRRTAPGRATRSFAEDAGRQARATTLRLRARMMSAAAPSRAMPCSTPRPPRRRERRIYFDTRRRGHRAHTPMLRRRRQAAMPAFECAITRFLLGRHGKPGADFAALSPRLPPAQQKYDERHARSMPRRLAARAHFDAAPLIDF